jgi:imidazolonepropionase-like amidohydrolase
MVGISAGGQNGAHAPGARAREPPLLPTRMRSLRLASGFLLALASIGPSLLAQAAPRPQPYCLRGVALDRAGERKATLILRDGSIEAILDEAAPAPPGTRVIDGTGLLCLPAFLDAFTRNGCTVPQPVSDQDLPPNVLADVVVDMRVANRKGIQPAFRAVEALALTKDQREAWRKSGFGAALVAPGGELLAGSSALATTREAAMRDLVARDEVYAHAAFAASGSGYPSTLMGYFAQLRQFFLDCQRHGELAGRYAAGRPGLRPAFDAELEAGAALVTGERTLLCQADSAADLWRWFRLADEFGLELAFAGGLEAGRVREELARRDVAVVLTLDWGKEPEDPRSKEEKAAQEPATGEEGEAVQAGAEAKAEAETKAEVEPSEPVWEYTEPLAVRVERRREWEEKRDAALRLSEAGVRFVFGSASAKPGELLERVRTLVAAGLPADSALDALTADAARFLGMEGRLGRIEPGHDATLVLWRSDPLTDKKASPAWVFVDGFPHEFPEEKKKGAGSGPAERVDPSGTWELEFVVEGEGLRSAQLVLEMDEDGTLSGTLEVENPMGGGKVRTEVEGQTSGEELELECKLAFGEFEIQVTLTAKVEGDALDGEGSFKGPWGPEPRTQSFTGKRTPK